MAYPQPPDGTQPPTVPQPPVYAQQPLDPMFAPPRTSFWTGGRIASVVAGTFLVLLVLCTCVVLPIAGMLLRPSRNVTFDPTDLVRRPVEQPPPALGVGWCVSTIDGANDSEMAAAVPCGEPHLGEVFEIIPISGDVYPGEEVLKGMTKDCSARLSAYAHMSKVTKMSVFALYPSEQDWQYGDRMVYCIVGSETVSTTGSVSKSF